MNKDKKKAVTELNENDRKILDKYTKFYTNFIESSAVRADFLEEERYKRKE